MDEPPVNYLLYRAGVHDRVRKAFVLYAGQFHRAVKQGDAQTLALVQRGFDALSQQETKALRDKWMGSEIGPFAWSAGLVYSLMGAALGMRLILVWGVTLRRMVTRSTAELLEQRQRLRTLLDTLPDQVWLKDLEGRYVICNAVFARFLGASEAAIIGQTDEAFFDKAPNRLHRMVNGVGDAIAATRDRRMLFDAVCRVVVEEGELRMAWIGEPDAPTAHIRPVSRAGSGTDDLDEVQIPPDDSELGRGPTGRAFREAHSVTAADVAHDPVTTPWRDAAGARHFLSAAAFPIKVAGAPQAVLSVYADQVNYFDTDEIQLLERLALQVGVALEATDADAARSRAEAELRASEERFSLVFRTSPVGMALGRQADGCFVDVNDAWLKLFGLARGDGVGRTGLELNLWNDLETRQRFVQTLTSTGHIDGLDAVLRRHDGRTVDIALSGKRIEIDAEPYMLVSFVDVTLRRQAAKTLQEQAQQLEHLVAQRTGELTSVFLALPDLYFRLAADGTIPDYRAGRESDLYSSPDQFLGRKVEAVLPADAASAYAAALLKMQARAEPTQIEYALPLPAGEAHVEARLLSLDNGEVVVVVRNITDRRAYEMAREAARHESERLSQMRSEFLANMSHEIRTPLNGIMGLAQIGWARSDNGPANGTFQRILDLSRQLLGIVTDVLDFSKIDANHLEVELVPFSLREVLEDAASVVPELAGEKQLALTVQIALDLPQRCLSDPLRLRQILLNLLANAIKFTQRGTVTPWAGLEASGLVVRVRDTGIGMAEAQLQQLFVPFRQADSSTTRRFGGTGLGLSISQRPAQLMGGDIHARLELGRGSEFELRLPLREPDADAAAGPDERHWRANQ